MWYWYLLWHSLDAYTAMKWVRYRNFSMNLYTLPYFICAIFSNLWCWGTQASLDLFTEWKFSQYILENTNKVWYRNLWNWLWPFDLTRKVTHLTLGWKIYLHFVLLIIPVDLICHMTMFEKNRPPGHPWRPQVPPPWAWSRRQNKNLVWYVSYLLFVFSIKILCNWRCYWNLIIFDLLTPQCPGAGPIIRCCAPCMWVTHTHQFFFVWFDSLRPINNLSVM